MTGFSLKILYDNYYPENQIESEAHLDSDWGFSVLITESVLFDTGADGEILLRNMESSGVDPLAVRTCVLSHDHWDHTGGLWKLLEINKNIEVFCSESFSNETIRGIESGGGRVRHTQSLYEINPGVFVCPPLEFEYKGVPMTEQCVVLVGADGTLILLTGCAHPGLESFVHQVNGLWPDLHISTVLGGFHYPDDKIHDGNTENALQLLSFLNGKHIQNIYASHCSGSYLHNHSGKVIGVGVVISV